MSASSILLARHAETAWNVAGRWQGHGDPPLSDRGRAQAEELAERLSGCVFDRLCCSDLCRARQTAEAVGRVLGLQAEALPEFRELDVGTWSGHTRSEIQAMDGPDLERFRSGDAGLRVGGGESRNDLRKRVEQGAEKLLRAQSGARILLVTHRGVIRALVPGTALDHVQFVEYRSA